MGTLSAQEIEPRAYANVPAGLNVAALSYSLSHGNIVTDASLPLEDFNVTAHTPVLAYVRTLSVFGKLGRIQVVLPFTHLAGDVKLAGKDTSGTRTGFGDARLRFGINFIGSPALFPKEFIRYKQETIIGASVVVSMPVGKYDKSKLINLGSNRWGFKPELGISQSLGPWFLEAYTGVWLFTNNNEFLETSTLKQKPIFSFQMHVNYVFQSGIWIAVDGLYVNGGRTSVDGIFKNDLQKNWRIGGAFSVPFGQQHSIKALFHTGVATRIGADFNIITIAYQFMWF